MMVAHDQKYVRFLTMSPVEKLCRLGAGIFDQSFGITSKQRELASQAWERATCTCISQQAWLSFRRHE